MIIRENLFLEQIFNLFEFKPAFIKTTLAIEEKIKKGKLEKILSVLFQKTGINRKNFKHPNFKYKLEV
jgi:hypothetical protein